jgi:hypothetical protein
LVEDTYKVELYGGGWSGVIGYARAFEFRTQRFVRKELDVICWESVEIPEFFIGHAQAILVAQGMPLKELFPFNSFLKVHAKEGDLTFSHGPYIFLKGRLAKPNDPPPRLKDVLIAHVISAPDGMSMERLQALLLEQVL